MNLMPKLGSVNAIGGCYSPETTYDYLPVDEVHPMRCSDPYSLSKYIAERQADAVALGHPDMSIITFRFHHVVPEKKDLSSAVPQAKMDLWGYVLDKEAARACILAMQVEWKGHEVIYIVGDEHCAGEKWTTVELIRHFYPGVEIRADKSRPYQALYRCDKAETLLGWRHDGKLPQQTRSHSPVRPPREDTGGCIIS
jgi:nucleoside-diphosphate-sugar epimerase